MKNRILLVLFSFSTVIAATGCIGFERESSLTAPTAAGNNTLMGTWSAANIVPDANACTDFKWTVSEQTNTTAKGSFTATCPGDLKVSGTAQGAFTSAGAISWSAQGNATGPGLTSCAIAFTGTAELTTSSIRIPYTGTTCLGSVSGTQILNRN
jgi:hypothetical protein